MNGGDALIQTLENAGVEVCFTNPGTSEMHMVGALDASTIMRPILVLFEGVASGAADGYARMAEKPACTLLHLGPGLSNAMANLHNARRAFSPVINIVGDHAVDHIKFDTPLTSDVKAYASACSHFTHNSRSSELIAEDAAKVAAQAMSKRGQIATLITHADHAWGAASGPAPMPAIKAAEIPGSQTINMIAQTLKDKGSKAILLLSGKGLYGDGLASVGRIYEATGVRIVAESFPARMERGAGTVPLQRMPYFPEDIRAFLSGAETIILVGGKVPTSFFSYEGQESICVPKGTDVVTLTAEDEDIKGSLAALADALGANAPCSKLTPATTIPAQSGKLTLMGIASSVNRHLPEGAIVSDESCTSGGALYPATSGAAKHSWLTLTGGSIGQGLPLAVGAAVACPDQKIICLHGDGGAMYTLQALWTQAREKLDVVTVIFSNRRYCILEIEAMRTGIAKGASPNIKAMTELSNPDLDWVALAKGMGVSATKAETAEEFEAQFKAAIDGKGPYLIEAVIDPVTGVSWAD
jgi:acetolactate synthase I/II/III large subunit